MNGGRDLSLSDMRGRIGRTLGPSRWFEMTQAMIDAHAEVVEDRQFIHIDLARAADTPFGGTVAHGFLTLGLLSAMAYDAQPKLAGAAMGVNYGLNHLRFVTPVRAGSRIRAHFILKAVDELRPREITLTWAVTVEIERAEKPALVAEWINRQYLAPD